MHTNILQLIHPVMYICIPTTLFSPHPQNKPYIPLSTFKTHFPITPNYHNLSFFTPTDTLHIHYKAKLASPHSTCMAMFTVNSWILHLIFIPCSLVPLLSVGPCTSGFHPCLPHPSYLWPFSHSKSLYSCCLFTTWKCASLLDLPLCAGRNGLPPIPDTLHFRYSYCLHPITLFFPLGVWL